MILLIFRYDHLVKCVSRLLTEQPRKIPKQIFDLEKKDKSFCFYFQGDSVNIFEDISKSIRTPQEIKQEQRTDNVEQILAEEQKPLFEVIFHIYSKSFLLLLRI